ncbi:hypothetical protein IMSHALPRED_010323 [Imshaugia aleurites]|uniref:Uncharacterized protein n=1 Tax=Imshaugia aleurites TaxID=172621 RepID=A0A8H3IWK9_9LECA|nr:hypothetical protein IMSHALPRED_010323 [Imshaugia aleurites]
MCEACDAKAKELVKGRVVPVTVKGNCSYSVYAGPELEFVVQFRLKSLMLKPQISALAREAYGFLAPNVSFHGQLGDDSKEPLFVYVMSRIQGISHLDFILANSLPRDSDANRVWRKTLMIDVARRLANKPQITPIRDDESGRYNTLSLDRFLVNSGTRIDDLE